jgi:hypothetical protein
MGGDDGDDALKLCWEFQLVINPEDLDCFWGVSETVGFDKNVVEYFIGEEILNSNEQIISI